MRWFLSKGFYGSKNDLKQSLNEVSNLISLNKNQSIVTTKPNISFETTTSYFLNVGKVVDDAMAAQQDQAAAEKLRTGLSQTISPDTNVRREGEFRLI